MTITIRPLVENDAYKSVKWRNDPEVFKYTGNTYSQEITIKSELEWIKRVISNPKEYRCAIIADNVYIGNIYLTDIDNGLAMYHIFIGEKSYWGKGVAYEASRQILEYGFNILGLHTIKLFVNEENISAVKLYNKLGFVKSGKSEKMTEMILNPNINS